MTPQERYAEIIAREKAATPGEWRTAIDKVSAGLDFSGYAHGVVIGGKKRTIDSVSHENYEYIYERKMANGYIERIGVGPRELDRTPTPDTAFIAHAKQDIPYLLARIRRAEELLRDASVVYEAHFMTEDHAEIDTFLAGDPPTTV